MRLLAIPLLTIALVDSASAQLLGTSTIDLSLSQMSQRSMLSTSIFNSSMATQAAKNGAGKAGPRTPASTAKSPGGTPGGPSPVPGSTTFRPVASSLIPQVLAELQAKTPLERQQRERQNLAHLESFKVILRRNGGEVHDVARAVSAFIMANYAAIAGKELTPQQASSLREQVRQTFATDPKFQASDDRQRQLIYETMAIVADVIWANTAEAREKNDAQLMEKVRAVARKQLEQFLEVASDRIVLTENGMSVGGPKP